MADVLTLYRILCSSKVRVGKSTVWNSFEDCMGAGLLPLLYYLFNNLMDPTSKSAISSPGQHVRKEA